jgi:hypothetical protein
VQSERTAVRLGDRFDDGETKTRAGRACREKRLENTRLEARSDAGTVVLHSEFDAIAA